MNTMKSPSPTPTQQQFKAFEGAYEYFNTTLFHGVLPGVILNLSRKSKAMGFVAPFRWRQSNQEVGERGSVHELSINPEILCMGLVEVYSTLVHEQCHIWQHEYGKPSRNGYHNKQWADKMEAIGLIPSTTGKPGGQRTGQNMSDYPLEGGLFLKALHAMPATYKLPFVSVEGDYIADLTQGAENLLLAPGRPTGAYLPRPNGNKKNKQKYSCSCGVNVWGKQGLHIVCGECATQLLPVV